MTKHLVLSKEVTLEDAIKVLDENGNGFLPITDNEGHLIGVITDGDLRRAILNKKYDLSEVMNHKPTTMNSNIPHYAVRKRLKEIHRRHMPLVNNNGKLVDVIVLNDFEVKPKENWVVIMAGGLGSRLGELTKNIPKPMLNLGEKPILEHIINSFKDFGYHKFVICLNYKADIIKEYFEDGKQFGAEIQYTFEKKRMGTAGALGLINHDIGDNFFVINGDVITTLNYDDFLDFHVSTSAEATMCVKNFDYEMQFACVHSDDENNLIKLEEKPIIQHHINAGAYMLNNSIIDLVPKNQYYDMPNLFEDLINMKKQVKVFRMDDYWLDIGRPDDYNKGNLDFNL